MGCWPGLAPSTYYGEDDIACGGEARKGGVGGVIGESLEKWGQLRLK